MVHGRTSDNAREDRPAIRFVERVYEGSHRLHHENDVDVRREYEELTGPLRRRRHHDPNGLLAREPNVRNRVPMAYDYRTWMRRAFPRGSTRFLMTCMNPRCHARYQEPVEADTPISGAEGEYQPGMFLKHHLRRMIPPLRGRAGRTADEYLRYINSNVHSQSLCSRCYTADGQEQYSCGQACYVFPVRDIHRKWVYIFRRPLDDDEAVLEPYCELEYQSRNRGMRRRYSGDENAPFTGGSTFRGRWTLPRRAHRYLWGFFMSPVRLTPAAVRMLGSFNEDYEAYCRWASNFLDSATQDWFNTVRHQISQPEWPMILRTFDEDALRAPERVDWEDETIPLVDPFGYASDIVESDSAAIIALHQAIQHDPGESSKAAIARIVHDRVTNSEELRSELMSAMRNDEAEELDDRRSAEVPAEYRYALGRWLYRYDTAIEHLGVRASAAYRQVWHSVSTLSHRIVDFACRDWLESWGDLESYAVADERKAFELGVAHWTHVFRDAGITGSGTIMLRELGKLSARQSSSIIPSWDGNEELGERNWIPLRMAMRGEGLPEELTNAQRAALPQLSGIVSPGFIAQRHAAGRRGTGLLRDLKEQLDAVGLETEISNDQLVGLTGSTLGLLDSTLEEFGDVFDAAGRYAAVHREIGIGTWSERVNVFGSLSSLLDYYTLAESLLSAVASGRPGGLSGEWANDVASQLASYAWGQARAYIESQAGDRLETLAAIDGISDAAAMATARNASVYRRMNALTRDIGTLQNGPYAMVTGMQALVETGQDMRSAGRGGQDDRQIAYGMQMAGQVVELGVAGAHCVALITGAEVAAWAGPAGWIASGILLASAVALAASETSPLRDYVQYSWGGIGYGGAGGRTSTEGDLSGGGSTPWMCGLTYRHFSTGLSSLSKWDVQHSALMHLVCGFTTVTNVGPANWPVLRIDYGFIPPDAEFQVEIHIDHDGVHEPETAYLRLRPFDGSRRIQDDTVARWPSEDPDCGVRFDHRNRRIHIRRDASHLRTSRDGEMTDITYTFKVRLKLRASRGAENRFDYLPCVDGRAGWVRQRRSIGGRLVTAGDVEASSGDETAVVR